MLNKTNGIVLHTIKYGETSVIARVYTELFGLQSYLVKGARNRKGGNKMSLLAPLTILEMEVYRKETAQLHPIREMRMLYPFSTLPFDVIKSTIALFINEIIFRSVREEEPNHSLYAFLESSIRWFDLVPNHFSDFHLWFMLHFCSYLGFTPSDNYSNSNNIFNLREGLFQSQLPEHADYLIEPQSSTLHQLSVLNLADLSAYHLSSQIRHILLPRLVDYYRLHIHGMKEIRSLEVLREVFN
ncbi:MAG: DNA repair protein RecO [Bacteroidota bacterium]|nr:DNA repair protein RecO [Bacteroidota bacterium]